MSTFPVYGARRARSVGGWPSRGPIQFSDIAGEGLLASALAWSVGLVVAVAFRLLAYSYYVISVLIGMIAIGFALGTTQMVALGVTWSWVVVRVGIVVGALLATLAIAGALPKLILALLGGSPGRASPSAASCSSSGASTAAT